MSSTYTYVYVYWLTSNTSVAFKTVYFRKERKSLIMYGESLICLIVALIRSLFCLTHDLLSLTLEPPFLHYLIPAKTPGVRQVVAHTFNPSTGSKGRQIS